jgi:uncharacterized lipoprotein YmbA
MDKLIKSYKNIIKPLLPLGKGWDEGIKTIHIVTAILGVFLSACANAPEVHFYVLEPINQTSPAGIASEKQVSIGVGPIAIPTLLANKKIITRLSDNTVQIAQFQQWASPLEDNLLQTLTQNLATLQSHNIVRAYPWSIHGTVDLQVIIDITRFDTTPGKSVNLEASWTIKNESSRAILKNGRTVLKHSLADSSYPGSVRALSNILGQFSQELSFGLLQVEANN